MFDLTWGQCGKMDWAYDLYSPESEEEETGSSEM